MSPQDLKQYVSQASSMFDDPKAVSREAFQCAAAIASMGQNREENLVRLAGYLGWSVPEVSKLASTGAVFRSSPPPELRALIAAQLTQQVEAYALFMVQVTRLACLQFAPGDATAMTAASAIAATITRAAPVSNAKLEPAPPDEPAAVRPSDDPNTQTVGEALDDLEALVGLEQAKRQINQQVQLVRIAQMRERAGLKNPTVSRHLVFVGNPGTGKTTVARIVGRIYSALGVITDGHLVETDASGMVAGFVGQTAIKTQERITSALGGILFIDEAYGLTRNEFGLESVDTLVKGMEDHRDSLVVIVAGYPINMQEFLATNPGLESRFPTTIQFADYTPAELLQILRLMCGGSDYTLSADSEATLGELFTRLQQTPDFANARTVRNVFEAAVRQHAWRLREVAEVSVEQMRTLSAADVVAGAEK